MNDTIAANIIYPRETTIFAAICAIVLCIIGVLGNFITILALLRCPKLKTHATTAFVLSLCLSDLLFCTVNLPLTASRYICEEWRLGDGLCKLFPVLFYGNVAVSVLNMVAITLNRYILISYPQYYSQLYSTLSIWLQLLATWAFSFLIMMPPLLGIWGQVGLDEETFSCTILKKDNKSPKKFIFIVGFVLPCIVIIISYSCIFWQVQKSRRRLKQHQMNEPHMRIEKKSRRGREDNRLTRLMVIIFVFFLLSFLPLMIVNVFDDNVKYPSIHVYASILAWMSSVVNPFIYAGSNRQYRTAYKRLFNIVKSTVTISESRHLSNSLK